MDMWIKDTAVSLSAHFCTLNTLVFLLEAHHQSGILDDDVKQQKIIWKYGEHKILWQLCHNLQINQNTPNSKIVFHLN